MWWICLDNYVDQDGNERVRTLILVQVTNEPCRIRFSLAQEPRTKQGRPKMTLQQFSIQMSLSRGAL